MQTYRAGGFVSALASLISICGLAGCAAAKPIENTLLSFDVAKREDEVDLDLAVIPTNLQGRDGKPVMASPRNVLVVDPRGTARIFSVDDEGHLRIRRVLPGRYVVYMADVEKVSASASSVVEGQDVVFMLLLARGQYTGSIGDYEAAESAAKAIVLKHPESGDAHLALASTLGTFHLFAGELAELDVAENRGAQASAVAHARAAVFMGQGRFDDAQALDLWRDPAGLEATELASAAVLEGERGLDADSERLFEQARSAYRDVSPFPVAWVDFQRGSLLERKGDRDRAKRYFAEAHEVLPTFTHAAVHLAGLETPGDALTLLEPLLGQGDDPEVPAAYGDALRRLGRAEDAKPFVDKARARYGELVTAHPEGFADHAASFYLGLGGDPARALALAKLNARNRQTEAALDLVITAALAAGAHDDACSAIAAASALHYVSPAFRTTLDALRGSCPGAVGVASRP